MAASEKTHIPVTPFGGRTDPMALTAETNVQAVAVHKDTVVSAAPGWRCCFTQRGLQGSTVAGKDKGKQGHCL